MGSQMLFIHSLMNSSVKAFLSAEGGAILADDVSSRSHDTASNLFALTVKAAKCAKSPGVNAKEVVYRHLRRRIQLLQAAVGDERPKSESNLEIQTNRLRELYKELNLCSRTQLCQVNERATAKKLCRMFGLPQNAYKDWLKIRKPKKTLQQSPSPRSSKKRELPVCLPVQRHSPSRFAKQVSSPSPPPLHPSAPLQKPPRTTQQLAPKQLFTPAALSQGTPAPLESSTTTASMAAGADVAADSGCNATFLPGHLAWKASEEEQVPCSTARPRKRSRKPAAPTSSAEADPSLCWGPACAGSNTSHPAPVSQLDAFLAAAAKKEEGEGEGSHSPCRCKDNCRGTCQPGCMDSACSLGEPSRDSQSGPNHRVGAWHSCWDRKSSALHVAEAEETVSATAAAALVGANSRPVDCSLAEDVGGSHAALRDHSLDALLQAMETSEDTPVCATRGCSDEDMEGCAGTPTARVPEGALFGASASSTNSARCDPPQRAQQEGSQAGCPPGDRPMGSCSSKVSSRPQLAHQILDPQEGKAQQVFLKVGAHRLRLDILAAKVHACRRSVPTTAPFLPETAEGDAAARRAAAARKPIGVECLRHGMAH